MQSNQSTLLATVLPRMHTSLPLLLAIAGCSVALVSATADTLDKTDCNGVVLDDSPFAEPIVRDHRDKGYGAFSNPAMRPLGGGKGYGNIVPRPATVVLLIRGGRVSSSRAAAKTISRASMFAFRWAG